MNRGKPVNVRPGRRTVSSTFSGVTEEVLEQRINSVAQASSGGSHVTIYEAEMELVPGGADVQVVGENLARSGHAESYHRLFAGKFSISRVDAGLAELERAGLVAVSRKRGRRPQITLQQIAPPEKE